MPKPPPPVSWVQYVAFTSALPPELNSSDQDTAQVWAVTGADVKATFERLFKIDSPGVGFYMDIVGAEKFAQTKTGHISGITTNDAARTITIDSPAISNVM